MPAIRTMPSAVLVPVAIAVPDGDRRLTLAPGTGRPSVASRTATIRPACGACGTPTCANATPRASTAQTHAITSARLATLDSRLATADFRLATCDCPRRRLTVATRLSDWRRVRSSLSDGWRPG